jgi:hypothetical protein
MAGVTRTGISGADQEDVPDEGRADVGLRDEAHLAQLPPQQLLQVRLERALQRD